MPELPEVETVVRGLRPRVTGRLISGVWSSGLGLRGCRPFDVAGARKLLVGGRVAVVERRAKYILVRVDRAAGQSGGVLVHLGMTGSLRVQDSDEPRQRHTHVIWTLDDGRELRFVDPRRFGWVRPSAHLDELPELAALGPDPLSELDEETLRAALHRARAPLKAFLLDQRRVGGLGNIYASEALFRARLDPTLPASRAAGRASALLQAIRDALTSAIQRRGTTFRDFVDDAGERGENATALLVYGREGQPCRVCGTVVRRRVQSARSTFYCPRCQARRARA